MAFEIVDGMTGTKHISSDDLSALNVATIGKANCVLKYGDDFKLTMASANSATLGTGVGMVGRQALLESGGDLPHHPVRHTGTEAKRLGRGTLREDWCGHREYHARRHQGHAQHGDGGGPRDDLE